MVINNEQIIETTPGMDEKSILMLATNVVQRSVGDKALIDVVKIGENRYRVIVYIPE